MLRIEKKYEGTATATLSLTLPFEKRQKSRFRAVMDDGAEVAVELPRGTSLRGGDLLQTVDGAVVAVAGAPESVSVARTEDPLLLSRAAYHLGNRHVPLQIRPTELSYLHDHVLDDMVSSLGLAVSTEERPFEPESGAYGTGHSHAGGHSHGHSRGHIHVHHSQERPSE